MKYRVRVVCNHIEGPRFLIEKEDINAIVEICRIYLDERHDDVEGIYIQKVKD